MPIKKSSLEQKRYYRILKVLFLILPFIILLLAFLLSSRPINICLKFPPLELANIFFAIIMLILYFLFLFIVWKIFIYIVFGGVEDDIKNDDIKNKENNKKEFNEKQKKMSGAIIPLIIAFIIFLIIFLMQSGYINLPKLNFGNTNSIYHQAKTNKVSSCPATSKQTSTPCHSVKNGVAVSGIIVPIHCQCPSDTEYAGIDRVAPGGPYNICTCK